MIIKTIPQKIQPIKFKAKFCIHVWACLKKYWKTIQQMETNYQDRLHLVATMINLPILRIQICWHC